MSMNKEIQTNGDSVIVRDKTPESGQRGSALSAVSLLFAWIVSIAVSNVVFLIGIVFCIFLVFLAGYAYPSVSGLLARTEVVPLLEEQIEKYLPGVLSKYRAPDTARTIIIATAVFAVIGLVLTLIGCIRLFLKAGVNPILLIVPLVNLYKLCSIANGGFLMFLGLLLPGVQLIAAVALNIGLSKAFGRSAFFAVPLLLLPPVFLNLLTVNREYTD